ncbi:uncharacterized protein LOC143735489 isoform X2 [Siphateles boraxobius]
MEGDSVTLKPPAVILEDGPVEWWFGDDNIAKMNKAAGLFSTSEGDKVGFKGKLSLDKQTGSLTITNITTDHDGLYKLQIRSSTEASKIFNVTVHEINGSVASSSVGTGIGIGIGIMIGIGILIGILIAIIGGKMRCLKEPNPA